MEALCLSVPYDPAFVLEVHKDVLKSRLRCARLSSVHSPGRLMLFIRAYLPSRPVARSSALSPMVGSFCKKYLAYGSPGL